MKNNNNKLTLKALQQELENIKAKSAPKLSKAQNDTHKKSDVAGHDIKNSYINNLHMRSSMFYLWLVTGILGYASKIPIVKKLIGLLSLWYGKTTIWKILIKLRKMFVVFNALIGMMVVFKTTGFGVDTFWAHFSAMGTEYAIIFKNFVSRLFNWLLGLFDSKIVPNVPTNKPSNPSTYGWWTPRGIDYSWNMPLPKYDNPQALEWVKNPFQINHIQGTPWYKDWSTILW